MKVFKLKQKSLFFMLVMLCMSLTAVAEPVLINGVYYELQNGWSNGYTDANGNWQSTPYYQYAAKVTNSSGMGGDYEGDIQIPETVNYNGIDYTVVEVYYSAFSYCPSLTSVELPNTVMWIRSSAFSRCNSLTSVTMPGVEYIESDAFDGCSSLTSLQLPESLGYTDSGAFRGNAMSSITVDENNAYYKSVDGVLYDKNVTKIVGFPNRKGGIYTIPSTIETIKQYTFSSSTILDELVIPASVTKIESNAFDCNSHIKKLTIEDATTELAIGQGNLGFEGFTDEFGNYQNYSSVLTQLEEIYWGRNLKYTGSKYATAFGNSYNLRKIVFGPSVTSIPKYSFKNCYAINEVDVKGGIGQWCNFDFTEEYTNPLWGGGGMMGAESTGPKVLFNGEELTGSIELPSGIAKIPAHGFQYGCKGITDLKLNSDLTEIADGAFKELTQLKTINIVGSNENFKVIENVLYNKEISKILCFPQLREGEYVMPSTIAEMGEYQFYNCSKLTKVTLSGLIQNIPLRSFDGCSVLSAAIIPSSVTTIGDYAFFGCSRIETLTLNNGLKTIKQHAFDGCANLTALTIPASVETIDDYAFYGCSGLATLTIGNGLKTINQHAFDGCVKLTDLVFEANSKLQSIGSYAFNNCNQLKEITIPASVLTIANDAFDECTSLNKVVFEDSENSISLGSGQRMTQWGYTDPCGIFGSSPVETLYIGRNIVFVNKNYWIDSNGNNNYNYSHFNGDKLTNVTIGCDVTLMPAGLFYGCYNITRVDYNCSIIEWCKITFEDQYATPFGQLGMGMGMGEGKASPILYLEGDALHSQVNIPEGATKIGAYSFYGQQGVSTFIVPSTVKTIEKYAFNAPYVSDVTINATTVPALTDTLAFNSDARIFVKDEVLSDYRNAAVWNTLGNIEDRICPQGFKLVSVDLVAMESSPALLPALNALERVNGDYRITALTNLKIRGTMNGWDFLMIRNKMPNLRYLDLEEATILDNDGGMEYYQGYHTTANQIGPYTFYKVNNLKTIVLPTNLESIGENAFAESGVESVTILGTSLTTIGNSAFRNSQLKSMTIPKTVRKIPYCAFESCYRLREVKFAADIDGDIKAGIETIESNAFSGCSSLNKLALPTTLKRIESYAFSGCSNLQEIDFAEGLQSIGYYAFQSCYRLKNLHMPTSLRRIENNAFQYCNGLTEVHVPSLITEIGDYAFKNCGLKAVYAYTVVPVQINQNTFDYTGVDLYAPSCSFYNYYLNTQWSQFLDVKEFDAKYTSWYTPRNVNYTVNVEKPILNLYDNNPADGSMEPGSGLIFIGDGEQLVKNLVMNWQHGADYPSLIANGNLDVEELKFILNVYPGRWYFFSFPFDVKLKDVQHDGKWVWRYYDAETRAANGSGGWKNVEGDVLKANQGYIFQSNTAGDLELPVSNPDFTTKQTEKEVALQSIESNNAQDASWNFVGNPNLSYYGLDDLADKFDAPITVWDDEQQTYTAVVPGDDDYDFHPFQAYFVQTPDNVDNITFEDENRATYVDTEQKAANRAARRAARRVNENRMLINLSVSDGHSTDKTRVIFNDKNKMDYEAGRDANKFMSMANVPQIYTLDAKNVKYSVNARPNGNREVRIGFVASAEGKYTINADMMDCRMALKDNETGTIHLLDNGAYTFFSEAGTFDNRFTLISGTDITAITAKSIEGVNIAPIDGGIVVAGANDSEMNIYKVSGVKAGSIQGSGTVRLDAGAYIVTYGGKSAKIVVK